MNQPENPSIHKGPWDTEEDNVLQRFSSIDPIPQLVLARELDLLHQAFSEHDLRSIAKSEWFSIDGGRYIIEIRNPNISDKLFGGAYIIDFDDCLFKSTQWHKKEYEDIATSPELLKRGIHISEPEAQEIYQLSKIKIVGKAEHEPRYTPLLNMLLLTECARQQEEGIGKAQIYQNIVQIRDQAVEIISRTNEKYLSTYPLDQHIIDIFANNSPKGFVYTDLVDLFFSNPIISHDLKVVATRGKIEGPFGQVYKLHASGIMDKGVDMVIYTNDIKAEAIILLSRLFPQLQQMHIRAVDDNPDEILPFRNLARSRGIANLKVIHVRHPDAKRKDTVVDEKEKPNFSYQDPISGAIYDHYLPLPRLYAIF